MFTPEFILQVVGYGVAVVGIVETIKRILKLQGMANWIKIGISIVASFVVTLPSLSGDVFHYLMLVVCVVLEANGLFKAFHKS